MNVLKWNDLFYSLCHFQLFSFFFPPLQERVLIHIACACVDLWQFLCRFLEERREKERKKNIIMMMLYPIWLYRGDLRRFSLTRFIRCFIDFIPCCCCCCCRFPATHLKSAENLNLNFICLPNHFFSNFSILLSRVHDVSMLAGGGCFFILSLLFFFFFVKRWVESTKKNTITKSMTVRKYEEFLIFS